MYYEYKICYWDEVDCEEATRCGVLFAEDNADMVDRLDRYYGMDNIISFTIYPLYPDSVYEFNMEENHFKVEVNE